VKVSTAAEALAVTLVDELVRGGVRDACLSPGSRSGPLALALGRDPRIRLHVTLDERSSAFIAVGVAKATGRAAVVLATSGTAGANFHPAVLEAHHSRTPLVVLTADRPPELRDTGANQTIDQIKLFGDSVRWFAEVGVPEALPHSVAYWRSLGVRALAEAEGVPPGPVHLNVALREPLLGNDGDEPFPFDLEGRADGQPWTEVRRGELGPSDTDVEDLASRIRGARRGVVVAGSGDAADAAAIVRLAEMLGWPLLADPLSGARSGSNAISTYDALLRDDRFRDEHTPDLVVRTGALGISKPLAAYCAAAEQVVVHPAALNLDRDRSVATAYTCDVTAMFARLIERIDVQAPSGDWLQSWLHAEAIARAAIDAALDERDVLTEPRLARDLVELLPEGSTVVVAASMPFRDVEWYARPRRSVRFIGNRGVNGIDGFVSTALGVALASEGPTFALSGDLSLLHDQNALLIVGAGEIDLTIVVVNNDGGGIFSFLPQARLGAEFEALFATPHRRDLSQLAGFHGCRYTRVDKPAELEAALAKRGPGIHIAEVPTDRAANVAEHRALNAAVAAALRTS